jgi:hypothetical protein
MEKFHTLFGLRSSSDYQRTNRHIRIMKRIHFDYCKRHRTFSRGILDGIARAPIHASQSSTSCGEGCGQTFHGEFDQ